MKQNPMKDSPAKSTPPLGGVITLLLLGSALWWCTDDHSSKPAKPQPVAYTPQQLAERSRIFTEDDFLWDPKSLPAEYKAVVTTLVNRIHMQDERCTGVLDPASVSLAASKTKPGYPVFYVTCGKSPDFVNVYFQPSDLESNKAFTAPVHYPDPTGVGSVDCQHFAKMNLRNPATADFDWGINIRRLPDGMTITTQKFTAKNSFGVLSRMAVECKFDATSMVDGRVYEIVE